MITTQLSWLEVFLGTLAGEGPKTKAWNGDREEALRSVDLYHELISGSLDFYRVKQQQKQKKMELCGQITKVLGHEGKVLETDK